eukprot:g14452.t1 g14452   contig9:1860263-1861394(+)
MRRLFRTLLVSAAAVASSGYVPSHMELPSSWTDVSSATLTPLEIRSEAASALEGAIDVTQHVVAESSCMLTAEVLCREEARSIAELAARDDKPLDGFGIFGIVKEVGVDDVGLAEFQTEYFPFDLYRDEQTAFYSALGLRKLKVSTWNPIKIVMGIRNMYKRLARKNISGNMKGEGLVQGGIIIFDKTGTARFAYREETGIEVPIDDIIAVVRHLKAEQQGTE